MVLVCDGHVCTLGLSMVVRVIIVTVLMVGLKMMNTSFTAVS